jgi:hypothetical protein
LFTRWVPRRGRSIRAHVIAFARIRRFCQLSTAGNRINDFSKNGNAPVEAVEAGMKDVVGRIRAKFAGIRIIGATLTSALGSTNPNHGSPEQDAKRKALNEFIRKGGLFDGIADFDAATLDPQTGGMRAEFVPESTSGGPGDKIHPNRVGYLAMGWAIDLNLLATIPGG